jgi:hypothetical protein
MFFCFLVMARLGLTGAKAQVLAGWKEKHPVVERSLRGFKCVRPAKQIEKK